MPVASAGIAGEAVSEGARELVGRYIEHMVTAARDALTQGLRPVIPTMASRSYSSLSM